MPNLEKYSRNIPIQSRYLSTFTVQVILTCINTFAYSKGWEAVLTTIRKA